MMKEVKIILFILAITLFVSSYSICDFFYYNDEIKDIKKWWGLKSNIYAIIMMLVFLASKINTKGILKFILNICIGLCIANVIDKVFFNVLVFTESDFYMIALTFLFSLYDYIKDFQNERTNK
jgi:hypothetical protein